MENFENKALWKVENPLKPWKRSVDDTFVIQNTKHKGRFPKHINSRDMTIKFTVEDTRPDREMPFLDIIITPTVHGHYLYEPRENLNTWINIYSGTVTIV